MNKNYFDRTFWKMTARFLSVIMVMLVVYVALNYYVAGVYGPELKEDAAAIHESINK